MTSIQTSLEIITPAKRYKPVGFCIYCRGSGDLTKEHIIPHGLAGNSLVLPESSCRSCAALTRDWETACLRHLWWPFRVRIGAPSSKKQRPASFVLKKMKVTSLDAAGEIAAYDKIGELPLDPMDFPLIFMAYEFLPPGVLAGREKESQGNIRVVAKVSENEFRKYAPNHREGFQIAPMNVGAYSRMLAKIAHAYAVAELGYDAFKPVLRRFIRGRALNEWHWIGSDHPTPPATTSLHDIRWLVQSAGAVTYIVVELRLFSFMKSPRYRIVVGELRQPANMLPFLEQPLHSIEVKTALPFGPMLPIGE